MIQYVDKDTHTIQGHIDTDMYDAQMLQASQTGADWENYKSTYQHADSERVT